jgi:hypothetical protein
MTTDDLRYKEWAEKQENLAEGLCRRCGACCGAAEGDPCEHLREDQNGLYACSIYRDRFGLHKTITGKPFNCVPLRDILPASWPGDEHCGYKKA